MASNDMHVLYPPHEFTYGVWTGMEYVNPVNNDPFNTVFLAGSIEMGKAIDWQAEVIATIEKHVKKVMRGSMIVFNPRRPEWDSSWEQTIENKQFAEQVNWELEHIARADTVFFYFQGETLSPISLMELGYALGRGIHCVVVCEKNFWRKGNIEVICERHNVKVYSTLSRGLKALLG